MSSSTYSATIKGNSVGTTRVYYKATYYPDGWYRSHEIYWDIKVIDNNTPPNPPSDPTISINPTSLELLTGEQQLLTTYVSSPKTQTSVSWISINPDIASVSDYGRVTAKKAGSTMIIARKDGAEASCPVVVYDAASKDTMRTRTKEGVIMTFKILDKDSKTCQVGFDKNLAISISQTGTITIPSSVYGNKVKRIGSYAFSRCDINSLIIPEGITYIDNAACFACVNLKSISFPSTLESIGNKAFQENFSLKTIELPSTLKRIGAEAFESCIRLENIVIHNDYLSVGKYAFLNTPWWNNQETGVVYLDKIALSYKGYLPERSSIEIKEGTKYINDYFLPWMYNVSSIGNLVSLILPNSIETIGDYAFYGCSNLKDIKQSENTITIGYEAFDRTAWMDNRTDGLLYIGKVLYSYIGKKNKANVDINEGTIRIKNGIFFNDSSLISINIPKSVRYIGTNIFDGCVSLDRITVDANNPYFDSRDNSNAIIDKSNHSLIYGSNKTIIPLVSTKNI